MNRNNTRYFHNSEWHRRTLSYKHSLLHILPRPQQILNRLPLETHILLPLETNTWGHFSGVVLLLQGQNLGNLSMHLLLNFKDQSTIYLVSGNLHHLRATNKVTYSLASWSRAWLGEEKERRGRRQRENEESWSAEGGNAGRYRVKDRAAVERQREEGNRTN